MTWTNPFLLLWMIGLFLAAWLSPSRRQNTVIAAAGLLFLATLAPVSLGLLSLLAIFSYVLAGPGKKSGWYVVMPVTAVIAVFAGFNLGVRLDREMSGRVVPLGLAFYGLRIIHYVLESYKKKLPPHTFYDYCRYLLFFPTFIAGPIHRFSGFLRDSKRRRWDTALVATGFERVLYGYVKIIVLANFMIPRFLDRWMAALKTDQAWFVAYMGCFKYGLNLYLQFSGYSDIAIGLALLIGFRVEENFNWPFLATSINDFWQRWHMTLSSWCRDYVFMPVSSLTRNPYIGVLSGMLVLGLWHEVSLRYCIWGLYHGAGILLWQGFQKLKERLPMPAAFWRSRIVHATSWAVTFNFVILGFSITSSSDMEQAWHTLVSILTFSRTAHV